MLPANSSSTATPLSSTAPVKSAALDCSAFLTVWGARELQQQQQQEQQQQHHHLHHKIKQDCTTFFSWFSAVVALGGHSPFLQGLRPLLPPSIATWLHSRLHAASSSLHSPAKIDQSGAEIPISAYFVVYVHQRKFSLRLDTSNTVL